MDKLQWEMLKRIPSQDRGPIKTSDFFKALATEFQEDISDASFTRKLQRNLIKLADVVGEDLVLVSPKAKRPSAKKRKAVKTPFNDVKEFSAYWRKDAPPLKISGLTTDEMIAFGVLQKQGIDLLPKNRWNALSGFFKAAGTEAAAIAREQGASKIKSKSLADAWLERIYHLPETIAFTRPEILPEIEKTVHEALLNGELLEIEYNHKSTMVVQPQAILQQGVRCYLVANSRGTTGKLRNYLMHRITSAKTTLGEYTATPIPTIDKHIRKGIGYPTFDEELIGMPIELTLHVDAATQWIRETKLSEDQVIKVDPKSSPDLPDSERAYFLEATVPLTERLIYWILSMSTHIKVISPAFVKARVKNDLIAAVNMY